MRFLLHIVKNAGRKQSLLQMHEKCWCPESVPSFLEAYYMVEPQGVDAAELNGAADGLANDSGAQVAHVHLLCDIWRREVHNSALVRQHRRPRLDALHPQVSSLANTVRPKSPKYFVMGISYDR